MPKPTSTETIQYTGAKGLKPEQKRLLDKISTEYYAKIKRQFHGNVTSLSVHIKCYNKQGKACKYSIHAKAIAPTRIFMSTKAADWDFARTLHKAFNDLQLQIKMGVKERKVPRKMPAKYRL